MDFSDLGGVPVANAAGNGPDFSDIGGVAVAPEQGVLETAARGALRNFPGAQQIAAAAAPLNPLSEKPTYSEEIKHLTEAAEQGKALNPVAYGAGAVAGSLAPLAIPIIGEGLAAAPILGNAAMGATQSIADTNLVEHPGQAAGEAAVGGGIGGILGALGKYFAGKAAPAAVAAEAPKVEEAAAPILAPAERVAKPKTVLGQYNIPPGKPVSPTFVPSAERQAAHMTAQGLGGTPRQLMRIMGKDPVGKLNEIRTWLSSADKGKSIVKLMDEPGELLHRVQGIHDAAGEEIGDIVKAVGKKVSVSPRTLLGQLQEVADDFHVGDPASEQKILNIMGRLKAINKEGTFDFDALQKLKGTIGKFASKDPALAQAYGHFADYMNDVVERYAVLVDNPARMARYTAAKTDYRNASQLLPILRYAEAKDLVGGAAGHVTLRGLLGSIVDLVGNVANIPPAAQVVKNAKLLSATPVHSAMTAAPSVLKTSLPQAAQVELTDALESRFGKKQPR